VQTDQSIILGIAEIVRLRVLRQVLPARALGVCLLALSLQYIREARGYDHRRSASNRTKAA
jgi:hypothetical protein